MKMQETIHAVHSYDFHFYHAREALSHDPFLHCCRCSYYYVVYAFFIVLKLLTFRVIHEMFGMYDFIELCFCRLCSMNDECST